MSIGLSIFLSALVLIAAWQIGKFGAWRKAGKIAAWVTGIVVIAGAGWAGVAWLKTQRDARAEADIVHKGARTYWGVSLGATQNDVLYAKGEPSERVDARPDYPGFWKYQDKDQPRTYLIAWDQAKHADIIICTDGKSYECDSLAGIELGMEESEVREKLGKPEAESGPNDKGELELRYGREGDYALISLRQKRVVRLGITAYPLRPSSK